MKSLLTATILSAFAAVGTAFAADPVGTQAVVPAGTVIELKDGGKLVMQKDGTTSHTDASGKRVEMKDGVLMEGKDGQTYVMKNRVVQKHIQEKRGGMVSR